MFLMYLVPNFKNWIYTATNNCWIKLILPYCMFNMINYSENLILKWKTHIYQVTLNNSSQSPTSITLMYEIMPSKREITRNKSIADIPKGHRTISFSNETGQLGYGARKCIASFRVPQYIDCESGKSSFRNVMARTGSFK